MIYVVPQRGIVVNVCILYIGIIFPPTFSTANVCLGVVPERGRASVSQVRMCVCVAHKLYLLLFELFSVVYYTSSSYVISCVMFKLYLIFHLARLKLLRYEGIIFQGLGVV